MLSNRLQSLELDGLDVDPAHVLNVVPHDGSRGALVPDLIGERAVGASQGIKAAVGNAGGLAYLPEGNGYPIVMASPVHNPRAPIGVQEHKFPAVGLLEQREPQFLPAGNDSIYPRLASSESDNARLKVGGRARHGREVRIAHPAVESQEDHGLELAIGLRKQFGYLERRIEKRPPFGFVPAEFGLGGAAQFRPEIWQLGDEPALESPFEGGANQIDHLLPPAGAEPLYLSSEGQEMPPIGSVGPDMADYPDQPRAHVNVVPDRSQAPNSLVRGLPLSSNDQLEHILHGHFARELGGLAELAELFFEDGIRQVAGWGLFIAANPADGARNPLIPTAVASSQMMLGGAFGHMTSGGVE